MSKMSKIFCLKNPGTKPSGKFRGRKELPWEDTEESDDADESDEFF